MSRKVNVLDLIAGVGGFSLGFKLAGYNIVGATDIDNDCKKTYELNFPNANYICADIKKLSTNNLKKKINLNNLDIIVGGPPCKGFSTIGARVSSKEEIRKKFDDRNYLFQYFTKMVGELSPKVVLFENVSGILTFNKGQIYELIIESFKNIGYEIETFLLDAYDYDVPQHRKRVFILARKKNIAQVGVPKKLRKKSNLLQFKTVGQAISDLAGKEYLIDNHIPLKHREKNLQRYKLIPEGGRLPEKELSKDLYRKNFGNTFKRLHRDRASLTMVPGHNAFPIHPWLDRSLTAREAARIQTFPDNFILTGPRHSQCLQVGNAVPVNLAAAWAYHLLKSFK
jgi:DNA (cytosine-5)-methyltransferase 1